MVASQVQALVFSDYHRMGSSYFLAPTNPEPHTREARYIALPIARVEQSKKFSSYKKILLNTIMLWLCHWLSQPERGLKWILNIAGYFCESPMMRIVAPDAALTECALSRQKLRQWDTFISPLSCLLTLFSVLCSYVRNSSGKARFF